MCPVSDNFTVIIITPCFWQKVMIFHIKSPQTIFRSSLLGLKDQKFWNTKSNVDIWIQEKEIYEFETHKSRNWTASCTDAQDWWRTTLHNLRCWPPLRRGRGGIYKILIMTDYWSQTLTSKCWERNWWVLGLPQQKLTELPNQLSHLNCTPRPPKNHKNIHLKWRTKPYQKPWQNGPL